MLESLRQWIGNAESLTKQLDYLIREFQLSVEIPSLRTVRLWRSKNIFSQPPKQKFTFRQILEGLATVLLLKKGWTLSSIEQILPLLSDLVLQEQILGEMEGKPTSWLPDNLLNNHRQQTEKAENTIVLLAQGILRLYSRLQVTQDIVRQDDNLPIELYQAMGQLGRLYIEEGKIDRASCVHEVLHNARFPLQNPQWNLAIFQEDNFVYKDVILIDSELVIPTEDCGEIAHKYGGFGEDNLIERRLYLQLCQAVEKVGNRCHFAYTKIRELLGRFSLISQEKLYDYLQEHNLLSLSREIFDFYTEVPDIWLINNLANRCGYCGTLMRPNANFKYPNGQCPIWQCEGHLSPKIAEKLDQKKGELLVALPQILTYWTAPAIDELAIYDTAKKQGLNVELYPKSDECDISINNLTIGIDAKSYRCPYSLAHKLNYRIGGLKYYQTRIIAINDRIIKNHPYYIEKLQEKLNKTDLIATLQIMSVSQVINNIKEGKYEN
jgi:hypothetical protein